MKYYNFSSLNLSNYLVSLHVSRRLQSWRGGSGQSRASSEESLSQLRIVESNPRKTSLMFDISVVTREPQSYPEIRMQDPCDETSVGFVNNRSKQHRVDFHFRPACSEILFHCKHLVNHILTSY